MQAPAYTIIPYQELLGNYDVILEGNADSAIIPYQELLGNYDPVRGQLHNRRIIPYQELLGNYDTWRVSSTKLKDYTIPRAIREL